MINNYINRLEEVWELVDFIRNSTYLDAFYGLTKVKKMKNENPDLCVYVNRAREMFIKNEYGKLVELCKKIIEIYNGE